MNFEFDLTDSFKKAIRLGEIALDKLSLDKSYLAVEGEGVEAEGGVMFVDCPLKKNSDGKWVFALTSEPLKVPWNLKRLSLRSGGNLSLLVWNEKFLEFVKGRCELLAVFGIGVDGFNLQFSNIAFDSDLLDEIERIESEANERERKREMEE